MKTTTKAVIPAVNYHLWQACNMRCKYCFATFQDVKKSILPKGHLPLEKSLLLIDQLAEYGFQKITFAGGEPTLCPWLDELIIRAKKHGLTTMIVSNGSGITSNKLALWKGQLDWITLSIDSIKEETHSKIGRAIKSKINYIELISLIKAFSFKFKINTVVNKFNYQEDISGLINFSAPERWKIFKALQVDGQNNGKFNEVMISDEEFSEFLRINNVNSVSSAVVEDNEDMRGSYVMIDPAGRFYDSSKGFHTYSDPILEVGIERAISMVSIDSEKFKKRGGLYEW